MLVAWLSSALLAALGPVPLRLSAVAATNPPLPVTSPPPCWCGRVLTEHTPRTNHEYAPAQGVESEAYEAW
jgi:hypothetical protein